MEVVGEASTGGDTLAQVTHLRPDVVLMDLDLPDITGVEAIKQIRLLVPATQVLVLTDSSEPAEVRQVFEAGAAGYLTKETKTADLTQAIRDVHRGEAPIHPSVARTMIRVWMDEKQKAVYVEALTRREREVLFLMTQGQGDHEIAKRLGISEVTVRTHVNHLLAKLQAANRVQAVLRAIRLGIVPSNDAAIIGGGFFKETAN
jgi:two-component system response regulator DegU